MNLLEQLKNMTTVVADSGDVDSIKSLSPIDATTNPSLILQAAQLPQYNHLINDAISKSDNNLERISDQLIVNFGCEILKHIPGRISTEVDARLSFNVQASIDKGRKLIALYESAGINRDRVLIKLASTWQGIKAAQQLEKEGIHCNLTLLFDKVQAVACAEAGITLISPFVGRILDWYKSNTGQEYSAETDPGVLSVKEIYHYFKSHGYSTQVMGASFRNVGEIIALAGCDLLTIAPKLLNELQAMDGSLVRQLSPTAIVEQTPIKLTESEFLWQLNENPMAVEKLSEGIRNFANDQRKLETLLTNLMQQQKTA